MICSIYFSVDRVFLRVQANCVGTFTHVRGDCAAVMCGNRFIDSNVTLPV
jgi:hypothetical protein